MLPVADILHGSEVDGAASTYPSFTLDDFRVRGGGGCGGGGVLCWDGCSKLVGLKRQQRQHPEGLSTRRPIFLAHPHFTQPTQPPITPPTQQRLPDRLILVRHAESVGNLDATRYAEVPDYEIPLSARGHQQAADCGESIRSLLDSAYGGAPYKLHFVTSPYTRSRQTFVGIRHAFTEAQVAGVSESVMLREQDFSGNFQIPHKMQRDLQERNRFGR
jgi:hypothetical protein